MRLTANGMPICGSFRGSASNMQFGPNLNRQVLALTLGVWAFHIIVCGTLLDLLPDYPGGWDAHAARVVSSLLAMMMCLAMHAILRRHRAVTFAFLAVVLASMIPLAVLQTWIGAHVFNLFAPELQGEASRASTYVFDYFGYQWVFFTWGALYVGLSHAQEVRARDRRLAEVETQAQQAQLTALKLQINPHFLFNTLNTIAGLVALGRKEETETTMQNLSQFLRYTLANAPSRFASVDEEVGMLQRYLRIEQIRFSDRLHVSYRIDAECARAMLPSLALLPLVENAIKHGLGESEQGITIEIGARREGEHLAIWVENGAGEAKIKRDGLGIGLENVRQRLAVLFGGEASLEAYPVPNGWRASLRLPWMETN